MDSSTLKVREGFITIKSPGYLPTVGVAVEFVLYDGTFFVGATAVLYHGDARNHVETVFVPRMSVKLPAGCRVYCAEAVHSWRQISILPESDWNAIASAPTNTRVIVFDEKSGETAMAWLDRIDNNWYYAPQGGLLPFKPTQWRHMYDLPTIQTSY